MGQGLCAEPAGGLQVDLKGLDSSSGSATFCPCVLVCVCHCVGHSHHREAGAGGQCECPGLAEFVPHSKVSGWAAGPGSRGNCRAEPKTVASVLRVGGLVGKFGNE